MLSNFAAQSIKTLQGQKKVWSVGERVQERLSDLSFESEKKYSVPNSVSAITSLVDCILVDMEISREKYGTTEFYIFHNQPKVQAGYEPTMQRLLPLDNIWKHTLAKDKWPTNKLPQILGGAKTTIASLIKEYLFVSLYRACADSLASENASRLEAMQRAEKNIDELLVELNSKYYRLRQSSIDEELFDVVSGFEALKKEGRKN